MSFVKTLAILLLCLELGCAHEIRLISIPDGAQVSINGRKLGAAPLLYQESSGFPGGTLHIKMELEGFKTISRTESKRLCTTPGNILMDLVLVGFLFGFCGKDEYVFDLTQGK